jgi:tetratricopeptide (TPR) repeat protein
MRRFVPVALLAVVVSFVGISRARAGDNDGQADLDKATEKKLSADSLEDLAEVLRLCESAMKAGLSKANTEFANNLYNSTLLQRGTVYTEAIFGGRNGNAAGQPDPRWPKLRELALADLDKLVQREPKTGAAYLMIAKLQALPKGDHDKALAAAEKAADLLKDEPSLLAAALVVRSGLQTDVTKKLADLDEALKLTPADLEALRSRAVTRLNQNNLQGALADLDALLKIDAKNPGVYEVRGFVLFKLKRKEDALHSFDRAIQLQPGSALPYIRRARIRAELKDTDGALEDLAAALRLEPENAWALLTRARIYQMAGKLDSAKQDVEAALKKRGDVLEEIEALDLRAVISAESGDYDQAIHDLEELMKVAPKNAQLLYKLGLLYEMDKQSRKAIEKFTAVVALSDKNEQVYRSRGDCYLNVGDQANAIADYEKAFKLNPDDSGLLNNFAWVLATAPDAKLRDGKRALELGLKACEKTGYKRPHILSTLAAAYAETGDFDNAKKWSAEAVKLASAKPKEDDEDAQDDAGMKDELQKEHDSYKDKKPWREILNEDESNKKAKEKKAAGKAGEKSAEKSAEKAGSKTEAKPDDKKLDEKKPSESSTAKKPDVSPDSPQQK